MADVRIPFCSIEALDSSGFCYQVCRSCEQLVPEEICGSALEGQQCRRCRNFFVQNGAVNTKRLYKLLLSVGTAEEVFVVVAFDRAAQVLMGCSADDFYAFASENPGAVDTAASILYGEMVEMVLRKPRNGSAQHLRVVSVVPLSSGFTPVMTTLQSLL